MRGIFRALTISVSVLLFTAGFAGNAAAADEEFLRFGYINGPYGTWDWAQYEQLFDGSYTHIIVTFLIPQSDGTILEYDAVNSFNAPMIARAHEGGINVIASIGGSTVQYSTYVSIANNPTSRTRFISEALRIMHEKGYDGLDINFEGWYNGLTEEDRSFVNSLAEELARAIRDDDPENIVTAALAPAYWLPMSFPCEFVNSELIDYAHHMSYDFFWGTMKSANGPFRAPGEIIYPYLEAAPIERSIYGSLNYLFDKGCDPSKMTAGIPFYSTHVEAWTTIRDRADWDAIPLDPDYLEKLEKEEDRYNWVNDPEAITAKIGEYKKLGLAGIIVWQVGHEGSVGDLSEAIYLASTGDNPPSYACSDGRDNDGDGIVDFPEDPGCVSETDDDEFEGAPSRACSDGIDNDGDGLVDFPNDPGCLDADDDSEVGEAPPPGGIATTLTTTSDWGTGYCANVEVKNNGSSAIDWKVSFETEGPISSLWNAAYSQSGRDVTAEGLSWNNIVAAGGAASLGFCAARDEAPPPPIYACSDGIDNDADGLIDFPADPGCESPSDDDEYDGPPPGEDISIDLGVTSDWGSGYCANALIKNDGGSAVDWRVEFEVEGRVTTLWNASYVQDDVAVIAEGLDWNNFVQPGQSRNLGFCAAR